MYEIVLMRSMAALLQNMVYPTGLSTVADPEICPMGAWWLTKLVAQCTSIFFLTSFNRGGGCWIRYCSNGSRGPRRPTPWHLLKLVKKRWPLRVAASFASLRGPFRQISGSTTSFFLKISIGCGAINLLQKDVITYIYNIRKSVKIAITLRKINLTKNKSTLYCFYYQILYW